MTIRNRAYSIIAALMLTTMAILGTGCSGGFKVASDINLNSLGTSQKGIIAFQAGLYAYGTTRNCMQCHNSQQSPYWMSADVNTAYTQAKPYVNFTSPTSTGSIFIAYAGNGHCGVASCQDANAAATVGALLTAWADAENSTEDDPPGGTPPSNTAKYLTATMAMPTTIPLLTGKTPALLRFDLSKLSTSVSSLSKAILEVQIQAASVDSLGNITEYVISNPRIGGNSAAVTITGIHVYIRSSTQTGIGAEDSSQGLVWKNVSATAAVFALPGTLSLTAPIGATPLTTVRLDTAPSSNVGPNMDFMTIGIDTIQ